VKDHPEDLTAVRALATIYQAKKRYKDAISLYERIIQKQPQNVVALNNLALLYNEVGDGRAVETAERAYKLKPEEPAIADTLGWFVARPLCQLVAVVAFPPPEEDGLQ